MLSLREATFPDQTLNTTAAKHADSIGGRVRVKNFLPHRNVSEGPLGNWKSDRHLLNGLSFICFSKPDPSQHTNNTIIYNKQNEFRISYCFHSHHRNKLR